MLRYKGEISLHFDPLSRYLPKIFRQTSGAELSPYFGDPSHCESIQDTSAQSTIQLSEHKWSTTPSPIWLSSYALYPRCTSETVDNWKASLDLGKLVGAVMIDLSKALIPSIIRSSRN